MNKLKITATVMTEDNKQLGSWHTAVLLNENGIIGKRKHDEETLKVMVYPFLERIWEVMGITDPHITQMDALRKIKEAKTQEERNAAWMEYDAVQ